jgi:hypothetical protein
MDQESLIAMTSDRTQAYGRVVKTLEDLGPSKLQSAEQDCIREAADTLIFAADLDEARATLEDIDALVEHLVATGRWTSERAEQLAADLLACGPVTPVAETDPQVRSQRLSVTRTRSVFVPAAVTIFVTAQAFRRRTSA